VARREGVRYIHCMPTTTTRRTLIRAASAVAPLAVARGASKRSDSSNSRAGADVYARIGVKPVINGVGTVTVLGGSLMPPEVVQAMNEASRHFVPMPELQRKVGARIAELLKIPAAMVTCGAASSIAVATAACMSRGDAKKLAQMPDAGDGIPNEVIQQKAHRSGYEHQMRIQGAKIQSEIEGRKVRDGEIVTACQAVCPTEVIVFGDVNDPNSRVSKLKAEQRNYSLLAELNTKPRTTYLSALKNPNPEIG